MYVPSLMELHINNGNNRHYYLVRETTTIGKDQVMSTETPAYPVLTDDQKENIKDCVRALRSGKYVQCQKTLCWVYPDGREEHCCLGVFCEVLKNKLGLPIGSMVYSDDKIRRTYKGIYNMLPEVVAKALGMRIHEKYYSSVIQHGGYWSLDERPLYQLNDEDNLTFEQIADEIEKRVGFKVPKVRRFVKDDGTSFLSYFNNKLYVWCIEDCENGLAWAEYEDESIGNKHQHHAPCHPSWKELT
jgi:hypothetical protein